MSAARTVVLRLVGGRYEGQWWTIPDRTYGPTFFEQGADGYAYEATLVATGSVEWDGDRCAEVYVPERLLPLWRAEHDVEV